MQARLLDDGIGNTLISVVSSSDDRYQSMMDVRRQEAYNHLADTVTKWPQSMPISKSAGERML